MVAISLNIFISAKAAASSYLSCFIKTLICSICLSTVLLSGSKAINSCAFSVFPKARYLFTRILIAASFVSSSLLLAACSYHTINWRSYSACSSVDNEMRIRVPSKSSAIEYLSKSQVGYSCSFAVAAEKPA